MTRVKCKVNSCYYWGKGEICQADNSAKQCVPGVVKGIQKNTSDK